MTSSADTTTLDVAVKVRAKVRKIELRADGVVGVSVTAPPIDNKANAEVIKLLAKKLGKPKSNISIVRGASGRRKAVAIEGLARDEALRLLSQE